MEVPIYTIYIYIGGGRRGRITKEKGPLRDQSTQYNKEESAVFLFIRGRMDIIINTKCEEVPTENGKCIFKNHVRPS